MPPTRMRWLTESLLRPVWFSDSWGQPLWYYFTAFLLAFLDWGSSCQL